MGRQKGYEGRQFKDLKVKCNRSQTWHQCLHCLAANGNDGSKVPKICGNSVAFLRHLLQYPFATRDFRSPIDQEQQTNSSDATMATSQLFNANLDEHPSVSLSISQREWMITKLVEFQAQCFLPDSFIESHAILESINAAVLKYLPKRRQLGGPILDKYASAIQEESTDGMLALQAKTGGRATFLNDVWQNITKNYLMGCLMALFGHYVSLGLFPTGPRHDAIALAQLMEKVMREAELNGWVIGAVVTDDAGQCGRARRILSLRWPHVVFLKCFAHDINNLVKAVLRTSSFREITTQATEIVNALHASSSKWLVLAKESMNQTYGRERRFIRLCDTRWNSMQGCFASLLRVKTALRVFATKYRNDKTFPDALTCLEDPVFWQKLRDVEIAVNPLCFASFKLQSDENTLADVVIVFRDLFDGFIAGNYSSDMISLLESRWRACEQPLFILALYLHPAYVDTRLALPSNTDLTNFDNIGKFAKFYYQKLLRGDPGSIIGEMDEWLDGDFTDLT